MLLVYDDMDAGGPADIGPLLGCPQSASGRASRAIQIVDHNGQGAVARQS